MSLDCAEKARDAQGLTYFTPQLSLVQVPTEAQQQDIAFPFTLGQEQPSGESLEPPAITAVLKLCVPQGLSNRDPNLLYK